MEEMEQVIGSNSLEIPDEGLQESVRCGRRCGVYSKQRPYGGESVGLDDSLITIVCGNTVPTYLLTEDGDPAVCSSVTFSAKAAMLTWITHTTLLTRVVLFL